MMTKNNKNKIDCLLIDTLGELKKFYFISDIIFVGGSILPYGGQSVIEPASLGKVVIFGPHMENFLEISQILKNCNAGYLVNTADELVNIVLMLQKDNEKINVVGSKAKEIVKTLQGATKKNVEFVFKHIESIKYV
jgi:3-deoxy-D-manno-octulosonic-acid transferase